MTARVHLVIPGEDDEATVASAAVFIKHNPNYDMAEHIPQIKSIVASGIDSLAYEAVNVALFPRSRAMSSGSATNRCARSSPSS